MDNVYADEAAFVVAVKRIKAYADALVRAGQEYNSTLQQVTQNDIQDVEISVRLNGLGVTLEQCTKAAENLGKSLEGILGGYLDELEQTDSFQFPDAALNTISAILAQFI